MSFDSVRTSTTLGTKKQNNLTCILYLYPQCDGLDPEERRPVSSWTLRRETDVSIIRRRNIKHAELTAC